MSSGSVHPSGLEVSGRAAAVFVPGLTRSLVERGDLPRVRQWLERASHAGVVPSFPCLRSVVQASVLCEQIPSRHGVIGVLGHAHGVPLQGSGNTLFERLQRERPGRANLGLGLAIDRKDPAWQEPTDAPRAARLLRAWAEDASMTFAAIALDDWADALVAGGAEHRVARAALGVVDQLIGELLERRPAGWKLLVCGAPALATVHRGIVLSELAERCRAAAFASEGAIACFSIPAGERARARDMLLATEGVERILDGDAPVSWGFTLAEPNEVLVLAEPGWAFVEPGAPLPHACAGHPEANELDDPVALWTGDAPPTAWPKRVHDYRLGTTLAQALGLSVDGLRDRPLTGGA